MRIMFGMFLFASWVIRTPKCEAVIFPKFWLACMHASLVQYISMPKVLRVHMQCMHTHVVHAQCDFAYNVNHVCMTSLEFTFHLYHKGLKSYDVIGVHVA